MRIMLQKYPRCILAKKRQGFSLMEVVVSMAVFVIALMTLMAFYTTTAQLNESSRNLARATNDLRMVVEGVRDLSSAGLATVTATNWTNWATGEGLTSLRDEVVNVTFVDINADPLQVNVQISWTERGRARTAAVDTLVTQR